MTSIENDTFKDFRFVQLGVKKLRRDDLAKQYAQFPPLTSEYDPETSMDQWELMEQCSQANLKYARAKREIDAQPMTREERDKALGFGVRGRRARELVDLAEK